MKRKILYGLVLADFTALNGYAFYAGGGLRGLGDFLTGMDVWTALACADLVIALSVVLGFLWKDAREKGMSFAPYAVLTALTGSIGPLVYLLRRPEAR